MSDIKTLHVFSGGKWVETGSASTPVVGGQTITEHTEGLPAVGPGVTPLQVLAAWSAYEPGLHLFTDGGKSRNLVTLTKNSFTGTTNTPDGEKPTASETLTATVFIDGTGSTYIKITTTAIDGAQSNAPSEIVANMGGQWVKMNSTKGDVPFAPSGMADIFGGAVAPDFTGLATEQFVTDAIAGLAAPDLTGYATEQYVADAVAAVPAVDVIKAIEGKDIQPRGIAVGEGNIAFQGTYSFTVENVGIGPRPVVEYREGAQAKTLVCLTRDDAYSKAEVDGLLASAGGSADLSAYAKKVDADQLITARGVISQGFAFDLSNALMYRDTEFGKRLAFVTDANGSEAEELLVYRSDLDPLNALFPRIESLESKQAPATEAVDLAPYALKTDLLGLATETSVAATYLTKSDARIYTTAADVAAAVSATYATKAETYTKAEIEARLLEVPSPMKYLQWGGAFQKMPAANAKDKWFSAGLIPSIQIVKGKRYRLEMTTKFGPFNTDVKECWVGFRFNYRALNELPCTKQPLVNMGGWGTTTVTRARGAIAATAPATTTPTRADRFRFCCVDDWTSAEDIIEYAVEFEADQDIASANFVPEICFGGAWLTFPTEFIGIVAVFRQMD